MWVSIGNDPAHEPVWPQEADYSALSGSPTLEVSIEPKPTETMRAILAEKLGQVIGADTLSVEWVVREVPGRRPPEWPVANVSFGDERGWDKERVHAVLNGVRILGQETLAQRAG